VQLRDHGRSAIKTRLPQFGEAVFDAGERLKMKPEYVDLLLAIVCAQFNAGDNLHARQRARCLGARNTGSAIVVGQGHRNESNFCRCGNNCLRLKHTI
jgi:hypothetical protein